MYALFTGQATWRTLFFRKGGGGGGRGGGFIVVNVRFCHVPDQIPRRSEQTIAWVPSEWVKSRRMRNGQMFILVCCHSTAVWTIVRSAISLNPTEKILVCFLENWHWKVRIHCWRERSHSEHPQRAALACERFRHETTGRSCLVYLRISSLVQTSSLSLNCW